MLFGARRTVRGMAGILTPTSVVCCGSGLMRYPLPGKGKSQLGQLRTSFGWINIYDGVIAGGGPREWIYVLQQFRNTRQDRLTYNEATMAWQIPASWKLVIVDGANALQPGGW